MREAKILLFYLFELSISEDTYKKNNNIIIKKMQKRIINKNINSKEKKNN